MLHCQKAGVEYAGFFIPAVFCEGERDGPWQVVVIHECSSQSMPVITLRRLVLLLK